MKYEEMSDFEINGKVAEFVIGAIWFLEASKNSHSAIFVTNHMGSGREFDPCNSWADAGPIIQSNYISIVEYVRHNPACVREEWWEADRFADMNVKHKNPLRAAMIVFLMMKESKNG
jgi:hypothetical protein